MLIKQNVNSVNLFRCKQNVLDLTWRVIPLLNPVHLICSKIGWQNWHFVWSNILNTDFKVWFWIKGHIFQSEFSYNINNILPTWRIIPILNPVHLVCRKISWQNWLPRPHSTLCPGFSGNYICCQEAITIWKTRAIFKYQSERCWLPTLNQFSNDFFCIVPIFQYSHTGSKPYSPLNTVLRMHKNYFSFQKSA